MDTTEIKLRVGSLSDWWLDKLSNNMEKHYPDIIGFGSLCDHWKRDGWNDGTTTLYGVYKLEGNYFLCTFPDYGEGFMQKVVPKFEHTKWVGAYGS